MTFNESNTVEAFLRDLLCAGVTHHTVVGSGRARGGAASSGLGWHYLAREHLPRQVHQPIVEQYLQEALVRLNPSIAAQPDRADEVMYRLRAIIMGVRSDGLVKSNEEFATWLTGEKSMPFGENGEHVTIKLIDFDDLEQNQYVVTQQYTFVSGKVEKRADLVLLINGLPLVVIEAKTPVRASETWLDGAIQVHDKYEPAIPELFVPNVFSVATDGREYRYGSIRMPVEFWGPWRLDDDEALSSMAEVEKAVTSMLRPEVILDLLSSFTSYATHKGKQRIKIIARYQQYEGANKLVDRVVEGRLKKGLIWHFQGSGKSLLMLFASQKLRLHPELRNPTVLVVVDRIDLDSQIAATFYANDAANVVTVDSRSELEDLLSNDVRKIIITTIHKFGEADGVLNDRDNIIVLVDEAHRTQEGDLGRKMRDALPNAFLFGLTGTPINRSDRNTFYAFGSEEDQNGYMSRYGFEDSIRDGATKELHFEPRPVNLRIDRDAAQEEWEALTADLSDEERDQLGKKAAKMAALVEAPDRVEAVCADIAKHFTEKVEPNGFGAQVVTFRRKTCLLYKEALDRHLPREVSDVVMSVNSGEDEYAAFKRDRDAEEKLLDRFRDPDDPLKIIIVTSKLLTGFDAPILQTMYLDRPIRDHNLLQAICRTNRPYEREKTHGLIVDYLGIFDDVAQALEFDEANINTVISNIEELKAKLVEAIATCIGYFPGVDRAVEGWQGLIPAQECLPDNDTKDAFAADVSYLMRLWEAISPDAMLSEYETDYRWIVQVYTSVKPVSVTGQLLWHRLGAKTMELIHQHVHVDGVEDELDTLVVDADLLEAIMGDPDPTAKSKEVEIQVVKRLRGHQHNPRFKALAVRLDELRERHAQGVLLSIDFLKELLELAKDMLETERSVPPIEQEDRGKQALTELFESAKSEETPIMVERVVNDIDEIVRVVRFDGWQATHAGEREVKKALRKTLFNYKLHSDTELFDQAYSYIAEYY